VLGPVRTRFVDGEPGWVSAAEVGATVLELSVATTVTSRSVDVGSASAARAARDSFVPAA